MNVESFFPGRLRISSALFKNHENLSKIEERIRTINGIRTTTGNAKTGSLTVEYDSSVITIPMLMNAKDEIEKMERELR